MECELELAPGSQEMSQSEPSTVEQPPADKVAPPEPGSISMFGDGKFRFPTFLWNLSDYDILENPMSLDIPEFLLSEEVFSLEVSIEATMLYLLDCALSQWGGMAPSVIRLSLVSKGT